MSGKRWTDAENEILRSKFRFPNKQELLTMLPDRSWERIRRHANSLGLQWSVWTSENIEFLKQNYEIMSKEDLLEKFQCEWQQVIQKACEIGVKRSEEFLRIGDMSRLLNENDHEALYWLGFLFADGHFTQSGAIALSLSNVDREHIERFAKFMGNANVNGYDTKCCVSVTDKVRTRILMDRYKISSQKTIEPVDVSNLSDEKMLSVFIGFMDGDGSIRLSGKGNSFRGSIGCHKNWLETFLDWNKRISSIIDAGSKPKITSGIAVWYQSAIQLRQMKAHALKYNLPIMKRKWDRVIDSKIRPDLTLEQIQYIKTNSQLRAIDLSNQLGVPYHVIWTAKNGKTFKKH